MPSVVTPIFVLMFFGMLMVPAWWISF